MNKERMANLWFDTAEKLAQHTGYRFTCNAIDEVLENYCHEDDNYSCSCEDDFEEMTSFAGFNSDYNSDIPDEWMEDEITQKDETRILFALFMALECDPDLF